MFKTQKLINVKQIEQEFHTEQNTNYSQQVNVRDVVKSNKIKSTLFLGTGNSQVNTVTRLQAE
jgi:hypothetical protein